MNLEELLSTLTPQHIQSLVKDEVIYDVEPLGDQHYGYKVLQDGQEVLVIIVVHYQFIMDKVTYLKKFEGECCVS